MKETIKTLITREEIEKRVKELAKEIERDYKGEEIYVLGLLKGSVLFMTDLIKEIDLPLVIDFMSVSSYSGQNTTGIVKILKDVDIEMAGKNILIVEDIIDTGLTLNHITKLLAQRDIKSLKICSLLDKPSRRKVDIKGDYIGFEIPDQFVIGYGLDNEQYCRNLPYIGVVVGEEN